MRSIGIRELRQNASEYIRLVEAGERIEVTVRGRPVAMIVAVKAESTSERLIREGQLLPAKRKRPLSFHPLEPRPGEPLPSEELMRDRYGD